MPDAPPSIPDLNALTNYSVNRQGQYEGVRQTLYDFQSYPTAGQTSLAFFQVPLGQSGKTEYDTNMSVAGSLPQPQHFLAQSIEIMFFPGVNPTTLGTTLAATNFANDMYAVGKSGWLDFFVGSKSYLIEAPLNRFPPKTRLDTDFAHAINRDQAVAADAQDQVSSDYAAWAGRPYFINPWVLLVPTQNFKITLKWPTAVATPSGQNGRIGVIIDGILYRESQ